MEMLGLHLRLAIALLCCHQSCLYSLRRSDGLEVKGRSSEELGTDRKERWHGPDGVGIFGDRLPLLCVALDIIVAHAYALGQPWELGSWRASRKGAIWNVWFSKKKIFPQNINKKREKGKRKRKDRMM